MFLDNLNLADFTPEFKDYTKVFINDNIFKCFKTALNMLKKQLHKLIIIKSSK